MNEILFIFYELLTVLLPALLVYLLLRVVSDRKNSSFRHASLLGIIFLACYVCAVLYVTGAGTFADFTRFGFEWRPDRVNLLPFSDGFGVESFLNLIMLVPLGFFVPLIWRESASLSRVIALGFCFSLFIEVSQLLNVRATDIDDLVLNTCGALLGYAFYKIFFGRKKQTSSSIDQRNYEPFLYLGAMIAGYFFLFDAFTFAKMLYGF